MDNAPYHHKREFKSFSACKNKAEIISEMGKAGVTHVTLPKDVIHPHQHPTSDDAVAINEESAWKEWTNEKTKGKFYSDGTTTQLAAPLEGVHSKEQPAPIKRVADIRIELQREEAGEQPNANTDGERELAASRTTAKYFYAKTGKRGTDIPTIDELKEACIIEIKRLKEEEDKDVLKCQVQELLETPDADGRAHEVIWTPAYSPWLQPIEVRQSARAHQVR